MLVPIALILTFLVWAEISLWAIMMILIVGLAITGFLLYDLVKLIKTEDAKKKYAIYISIIIGELIILIILSIIFNESNLLTMIGLNIMFGTVCAMLINIAKATQNVRMGIGCLLHICIFILIVFIIINNIAFFVAISQSQRDGSLCILY